MTIGIGDPREERFEDLEVIAETGSTFTTVPRTLLEGLGVPVERTVQSELADGTVVPTDVGLTMIRLEGQEFPTPVFFSEEGELSLLGVIALEHALLAVDPHKGRLVPVNARRQKRVRPIHGGEARCALAPSPRTLLL